MQLHHGHATLAPAARNSRHTARATRLHTLRAGVWMSACFACLIAACGDDGTDGLSSCPEGKIVSDNKGVLKCASLAKPGAGRGGSTAKDGTAGAKAASNTQASTGTGTPPQNMAAANKPAASGAPAAMSGQADRPASSPGNEMAPPASGEAGKPADSSAGQGMSSGATPQPAAAGTKTPAANSGGGSLPSLPAGPWSCVQAMDVCSCVPHEGLGDGCTKPHPTCCNLVLMNGAAVGCVCVPPNSQQCTGMNANQTNYPSVDKCPPN